MQKVLTSELMRAVVRRTRGKDGIASILLLENAAHAAVRAITEKLGGSVEGKSVLVLCGKGNNGGDGAALARILWTQGANVDVYLFGKIEETKEDARVNFEILKRLSQNNETNTISFEVTREDDWLHTTGFEIGKFDILVDALFGTGLTKPIDISMQRLPQIFSTAKKYSQPPLFVSIDLPSGLNADLSESIGEHFQADLTVTFTAPKLANVFPLASNFNGELRIANIGSPDELIENSPSQTFVAEKEDVLTWLDKTRVKTDSYKKTRGTALIVAGSKNYSGAAILAANACFGSGAGMISVGVPESVQGIVAAKVLDEIITRGFSETKDGAFAKSAAGDVLEFGGKMNVVAFGCGLTSNDESTRKFAREIVENRKTPMVIDADGLNALAPFDLKGSDKAPLILTPHIGEFQRLLGTKKEVTDRIKSARDFAQKHNVILVLKGTRSLIAAPGGKVVINPTGSAGISRAGSGDTLTGIITGFLAQTYGVEEPNLKNTFETVAAALYVAGLAGDIAAEIFSERLMSASDIRGCLNKAIEKIKN